MVKHGQIFSPETQAVFYNWKQKPIQRMLDFDFLCGEHATIGAARSGLIAWRGDLGLSGLRVALILRSYFYVEQRGSSGTASVSKITAIPQVEVHLQLPALCSLDPLVAFRSCFLGLKK